MRTLKHLLIAVPLWLISAPQAYGQLAAGAPVKNSQHAASKQADDVDEKQVQLPGSLLHEHSQGDQAISDPHATSSYDEGTSLDHAVALLGKEQAKGFEENKGQVRTTAGDPAPFVRYRMNDGNTSIFLLDNGIAYQFNRTHLPDGYAALMAEAMHDPRKQDQLRVIREQARLETHRMDMLLDGASSNAHITSEGRSDGFVQYYGHDALDVRSYEKVTYHDVYPGIDWVVYTTAKGMKYDFLVHPGADPAMIRLRFKDQEELRVDVDGSLIHGNSMGQFTEQKPVSFQGGKEVPTSFVLEGEVLHFSLGAYDRNTVLIIDPARVWGTYYGGTDTDYGFDCETDADGNVYLIGSSFSNSAIASGGHQITIGGGQDAMLVKFDENGTRLWSTYYGGTGDEQGISAVVDATSNVYLMGSTSSTTTIASGGHQNTFGGGAYDGFLVKFDPNGSRLWGTYYGGTGYDVGYSCALDPSGSLLIAGYTGSTNAIAAGGHQNTYGGGAWDAFLAKFSASGTRTWGTYYGGSGDDYSYACAPGNDGNIYLGGYTSSSTAISSGGHQNAIGGGTDAFLAKFNTSGSRIWGTYYGGALNDVGYSCTVDPSGNAFLNGYTSSTTAIASGGHQNTFGGNVDGFLAKFNPSGGRAWGTYYGGTGADYGRHCATDVAGNVYLIGYASSTTAIANGGHQNTYGGGTSDVFLARFNPSGTRVWGTYYGGSTEDVGFACTVDTEGNVYATGYTASNAAIAAGGHQNTYGGGTFDAFLAKFRGGATQDCTGYWGGTAFLDACGNCAGGVTGLEPCDQYRSKQTGNWHLATTWERFNGATWVDASTYPTASNSDSIMVRSTHVVTLLNTVGAIPMDDLAILAGGTLTLSDGCHNFNDDPLEAVDVRIYGTYNGNGACGSMGCCGTVSVESGGVINYSVDGSNFTPTIVQIGGTFNTVTGNEANVFTNHGTFNNTSGSLTIRNDFQNHGTLNMTDVGGGNLTIANAGTFNNTGTSMLTNKSVNLSQMNSTFTNSGTFNLNGTAGGNFSTSSEAGQVWSNAATGIINVNSTTAVKGIGCCTHFNNAGTFNLNATQINQSSTFNNTGALNIAPGATFNQFAAGTNSGTISIASGGSLIGSMTPFLGSTLTNNGSVSLTALEFAGTSTQQLNGTGTISSLTINNANGVTLGGTQTVTGTLTFTNGRITLGNNDLILSNTALDGLAGTFNATNRFVTNGTGAFHRQIPIGGSNYPFPIGTASSYLPVTLSSTSGPAERFGARVADDVHSDYSTPGTPAGAVVVNDQVERTWTITELTNGSNQATVQLQWNSGDEGTNFGRANSGLQSYNGTDWLALPLAAATGTDPYTRNATNVGLFREFTVADGETALPEVCNNGLTVGSICNDNDACTINDVVNAGCVCAGAFQDTDGDGTCNVNDGCPDDPNKIVAGVCGCGVSDLDTDSDGTPDCEDDCPLDPNKTELGDCGCGVPDTDTDSDGTADCTDGCPNDPLKTSPGGCGCGTPDVDANNDGVCDSGAGCIAYIAPNGGSEGGGPAITIYPACPPSNVGGVFIGVCTNASSWVRILDLSTNTVVHFGAMDGCGATGYGCPGGGTSCLYDSWALPAGSYRLLFYVDAFAENALACASINFSVPGAESCCSLGPVGTPCDADHGPGELPGTVNSECACIPSCTETVTVELRTDALSSQASWQILEQNTNTVLCQFTVPVDGITTPMTENCCLPVGCYRLRVLDSGGDGFVGGGITGGYQLREAGLSGRRIIDNLGNFATGSTSAIASNLDNGSFCVPIGTDRLTGATCDKLDWVNNQFLVATENVQVSGQYNVTNTTSGYEFWIYDPNGTYSYRRFRNHATSDGTGSGATRACHMKVNGWINNALNPHIPQNMLLNIRVRGRVAGANLPFGPACLFKIDAVLAACPLVKLQDDPSNVADFSCGVNRVFGGGASPANRITARPPQFVGVWPPVTSGNVRYQFRFRIPGEIPAPGSCIVRPPQTSATLNMNWTTGERLKCNTSYEVDVRVSKDAGATWCVDGASPACSGAGHMPWGKLCTVNITTSTYCPSTIDGGASTMSADMGSSLTLYPNPNRGDQIFLSLTGLPHEEGTVSVEFFDMTGALVGMKTIAVPEGELLNQAIELEGELRAGLYLVNITAGGRRYTERLVIQP